MSKQDRIYRIVSESLNKVLNEVRYIDNAQRSHRGVEKTNVWWNDTEELKKKIVNYCETYFKWTARILSENGNQLTFFIQPTSETEFDKEQVKNTINKLFWPRIKPVFKDRGNGLYVSFYVSEDHNYSQIGKHEKIRVFHGTDIKTAIQIAKNGVSGKERISRSYTFENGMNPNGLFVTTDFYQAKEFGYHYDDQVILEFTVDSDELDTPVWNGQDSYFGQGTNPQPFISRSERNIQKRRYQQYAELSEYPFVSKSNNPGMAKTLMTNDEHQALYFGDLTPNQIKRFWYRKRGTDEYVPLSFRKFMSIFGKYSYKSTEYGRTSDKKIEREKLYWPNENWNGVDDFVKHCESYYKSKQWGWSDDDAEYFTELGKKWEGFGYGNEEPTYSDTEQMRQMLFPKQLVDLLGDDRYRQYFDKFYPEWKN